MNLFAAVYKLLSSNFVRKRLLSSTNSAVMKQFYSKPFPDKKALLSELEIISLDIETSGLNPEEDHIVSIGLVQLDSTGIRLDSCWHQIIKVNKNLSENSVVIHHITDDQSATGIAIDTAISQLLERLSGKVMLVHSAKIEMGFINKICQKLYDTDFFIPVIDTQYLAKRSLDRQNSVYTTRDLRLFNLRQKYNMPAYKAHNALMDAIATAELFLALVARITPNKNGRLADFIS